VQYYQIKKKAVYEILDTEAIVINFETGDYYTLPCLAKQIWQMIEKNASVDQMIEAFIQYHHCDHNTVQQHITLFLNQLVTEGLLEPAEETTCNDNLLNILNKDAKYQWDYNLPVIHKYSDIDNLLLLDPVHDVDSSGWPNKSETVESV
jgi:hypothetical protein